MTSHRLVALLCALFVTAAACVPAPAPTPPPPPPVAPPAATPPPPQGPALGAVNTLLGVNSPVLPHVSDPAVVLHDGLYYVYASNTMLRGPVTVTPTVDAPMSDQEYFPATHDAMPQRPAWAANERQLWAPSVARFGNRWVMFYATDRRNPPQPHNAQCIGRAWADHPAGPFVPEAQPWDCGIGGRGGALDPEVFTDTNGQRWLLMAYSDTNAPLRSVRLDGHANASGAVNTILDSRWGWEYWFIENPSMVRDPHRGDYVLAYSAGKWDEAAYSTGVARCSSPAGPCTSRSTGAWIRQGAGRSGTGGFTFFTDATGAQRALLSSWPVGAEGVTPRGASVLNVGFGNTLTVTNP